MFRRSAPSLVIGTFMTASAVVAIVLGDRLSFLWLVLGISILTGLFAVPIVWWVIHRRRDLILAPVDVEANADGITITSSQASAHQEWSVYRRVRETSRAFLLDTGVGTAVLLTKRGIEPAEIEAFRSLLARAGILAPQPAALGRLRPLLWVAVGLIAAAALILGPRTIAGIGATANMTINPIVQGSRVTVEGTTDIPDGAIIAVQVVQLEGWEREAADGVPSDAGTSPWVRSEYVLVQNGRYSSSFETEDWPGGRVAAIVYFWIDARQPRAVIDRFEIDGSALRGPDVVDREDRGPTLELQRLFELPDR